MRLQWPPSPKPSTLRLHGTWRNGKNNTCDIVDGDSPIHSQEAKFNRAPCETSFAAPGRLFLSLMIAAVFLPASAHAQKILRFSDHESLGGMRTRFIKDVFFAAIENESKGRLKVDDQWDGKLAIS